MWVGRFGGIRRSEKKKKAGDDIGALGFASGFGMMSGL